MVPAAHSCWNLKITRRDVQQEREVAIFKQVFIKKYKASINLYEISINMLHVMRIVLKVSRIMFARNICLQLSGTKYPVITTSNQVSGTKLN